MNETATTQAPTEKDALTDPQMESALKTQVYRNADGSVCCQNYVYGMTGQHWTLYGSGEEQLRKRKREEAEEGQEREWIETGEPCPRCTARFPHLAGQKGTPGQATEE